MTEIKSMQDVIAELGVIARTCHSESYRLHVGCFTQTIDNIIAFLESPPTPDIEAVAREIAERLSTMECLDGGLSLASVQGAVLFILRRHFPPQDAAVKELVEITKRRIDRMRKEINAARYQIGELETLRARGNHGEYVHRKTCVENAILLWESMIHEDERALRPFAAPQEQPDIGNKDLGPDPKSSATDVTVVGCARCGVRPAQDRSICCKECDDEMGYHKAEGEGDVFTGLFFKARDRWQAANGDADYIADAPDEVIRQAVQPIIARLTAENEKVRKYAAEMKESRDQFLQDSTDDMECLPGCNSYGHEEICPVVNTAEAWRKLRERTHNAERERDEAVNILDSLRSTVMVFYNGPFSIIEKRSSDFRSRLGKDQP